MKLLIASILPESDEGALAAIGVTRKYRGYDPQKGLLQNAILRCNCKIDPPKSYGELLL